MHLHFALFITAAAFWAVLPVKLVAIAGTAYVLIATLKQIFPALTGWKSIALNIAVSVTSVLAVAKPGDLESPNFWASLMLTIASAAGIHGTVKSFSKPTDDPTLVPASQGVPSMRSKSLVLVLVLMGSGMLAGCHQPVNAATPTPPPALPSGAVDSADAAAYKTLKPAFNFAASMSGDVKSGQLVPSANLKLALESLNRALNVADTAAQSYHHAGGGDTAALNAAVGAALQAFASAQGALSLQSN